MIINFAGLGYAIISLCLIGATIVGHRWTKHVTKFYWFWLGISLTYLIYDIAVVWSCHWTDFAHLIFDNPTPSGELIDGAKTISDALLLNICPFLNFALPVCLIADPSRKAARGFAPLAILASAFVLFLDMPFSKTAEWSWQYVFGFNSVRDLYFLGHLNNMLIAVGVLLTTPKFGWKGMAISYAQVGGFYLYVGVVKTITCCGCYTSGLSAADFTLGNYAIFKTVGITGAAAPAMFFIGLILLLGGIILLWDFCKRNRYAYGDKVSDCWWTWYDENKFVVNNYWGNNKMFALNRHDRIWTKGK